MKKILIALFMLSVSASVFASGLTTTNVRFINCTGKAVYASFSGYKFNFLGAAIDGSPSITGTFIIPGAANKIVTYNQPLSIYYDDSYADGSMLVNFSGGLYKAWKFYDIGYYGFIALTGKAVGGIVADRVTMYPDTPVILHLNGYGLGEVEVKLGCPFTR